MKITEKPWGKEILLHQGNGYAVKEITLNSSCRTSLHYHEKKHEFIYVLSGKLSIEIGPDPKNLKTVKLGAGDSQAISPQEIHRMSALATSVYLESQTDHLDDVVRIQDDFNRG